MAPMGMMAPNNPAPDLPFISCGICNRYGPAHRGGTATRLQVEAAIESGWIEGEAGQWTCPKCREQR